MESGLSVLKGTQFELVRNGDFFKEKRIANVLNYEKGSLLIATVEYGAFLYNNGSINPFQFKGDFWRNDYLINYSTRLRNGNIAIGTQNAGLFIVEKNGELVLHLDKESGLMDLTINYIYEDINGGLWLAMNNGVARVDLNSPFTFIDDRMGLSGSGYTALLQDDVVYLGTNNGLFKWENGKINFVGGTSGQVYTIQELNGKVLVGHHNGTFIVEGGKA
ncbi:MAG TPA: two component regulator three y domain-containing protein, partial [Algoriphagus sp.]|nr:two component regulator three y domain-containing protein [Algoriphagus sp.]